MLYDHFGHDRSLRELFALGETPHAKILLLKALTELHDKSNKPSEQPATTPQDKDKVLQALHKQWNPLYQKMNMLRHKIDQWGNDNSTATRASRTSLAEKILSLEQQINQIWAIETYYKEHGQLPETKTKEFKIPEDPYELAKLIERVKHYIRKHKNNLRDNPGNATYAALLQKYETQLKLINDANKKN